VRCGNVVVTGGHGRENAHGSSLLTMHVARSKSAGQPIRISSPCAVTTYPGQMIT
jgi:hypothetical protein